MKTFYSQNGFTVVELVIVIIIMGIIAGVAMRQLQPTIENSRYEQTLREMENIGWAITGNPNLYSDGARTDFGYVGDVGGMPPSLDALVANPGGFTTWKGPYMDRGLNATDFKEDAWGVTYLLSDTAVRSVGSGETLSHTVVASTSLLLSNTIEGVIINADGTPPGALLADSIVLRLDYPDGSGGRMFGIASPDASGAFSIGGLPVGNHTLSMIYIPDHDTVQYTVSVLPGRTQRLDLVSPADLW